MKKKIYLVLGNHLSLRGINEQVLIIESAFKNAKIGIEKTLKIKPNEINIIIEEFHKDIALEIIEIKDKFPDTILVLFSTEYLTGKAKNKINCFTLTDSLVRCVFKSLFKFLIFAPVIRPQKINFSFLIYTISMEFFLKFSLKLIGRNYHQELMFARREYWLFKLKSFFDAVFASSEQVLNTYSSFTKGRKIFIPVFVNSSKLKLRLTEKSDIKKNIFFSGNLTSYRKKIIELLNSPLEQLPNPYPLVFSKNEQVNFDLYPKLLTVKNLKNKEKIRLDEIPLYEIYIPQSKYWKFSSPCRSIFSFHSGCIPVCYGYFNQHPIDQLFLIKTKNPNDFYTLQNKDPSKNIREMLSKIERYNRSQLKHLKQLKTFFELVT